MKVKFYIVILLAFGISLDAQNIDLELLSSGLTFPLDITHAGDDRLFVVERGGKVKIITSDGNVLPTPFLDIDPLVFNASNQDERGLLGIAFHPEYTSNGYFFLNYIDNSGSTNIVRYQVDDEDPNKADPASRELILMIEQPVWNHNGGCLKFGSDGYLYIGMGDGGSGNDPFNNGQNPLTLLGKMLRIDVDNGMPYAIPEDNPFANDDFTLDEIWATGLRNPWRYSFDKETGDMWIGDVGQSFLEEIDFQPANSPGGENYGWRCYEGTDFTNNSSANDCQGDFTDPVFEIQQSGFTGPCSITGGFVYRGTKYSELIGKYICADYCSGEFFIVEPDGQGGWNGGKVNQFQHDVSTFGEDINGELYIASFSSGRIYHITGENIVSTKDIPLLEEVNVYPNPTTGKTHLDLMSSGNLNLELQLVDMTGKTVLSKLIVINGKHQELIDMNGFASGSYILNISSQSGLLSKQLIVY